MRSQIVSLEMENQIFFKNLARLIASENFSEDEAYEYCKSYYANVVFEDLNRYSSKYLAILLRQHMKLAGRRSLGEAAISINSISDFTSYSSDNIATNRSHSTIIQVVTEDMPFLVDSITIELARRKLGIHMVVHPTFLISERHIKDDVTHGIEVKPFTENLKSDIEETVSDFRVESWIYLEIDRISDSEDLLSLQQALSGVLEDVRVANRDWKKMRARALDISKDLDKVAIPELDDEIKVTQELLRWMESGYFTFLGYREYDLISIDNKDVLRAKSKSGLGILRNSNDSNKYVSLTAAGRRKAREKQVLVITKANSRSTVHKLVYLDYIGVKTFDAAGNVVGEKRFLGLFTSIAYNEVVNRIPVIKTKIKEIFSRSKLLANSHFGRDLKSILETYPRDELFQIDVDTLYSNIIDILRLQERRRTTIFFRQDVYGRFFTALVYLPRDRYNTDVKNLIEEILLEKFNGISADFELRLSDSSLARIYFTIRVPKDHELIEFDSAAIEKKLVNITRSWKETLLAALVDRYGLFEGEKVFYNWQNAFPEAYKVEFDIDLALQDIHRYENFLKKNKTYHVEFERIDDISSRIKIYLKHSASLTQIMPYLHDMGLEVLDERPFKFSCEDGENFYLYDFCIATPPKKQIVDADIFTQALEAIWVGECESDCFNELIVSDNLPWRKVLVLRAYMHYFRQIGLVNSYDFLAKTLLSNGAITNRILEFFDANFNPDIVDSLRENLCLKLEEKVLYLLNEVTALDADRILRGLFYLVKATLRTNFYQKDKYSGEYKSNISFKFATSLIPNAPVPVPLYEIWVYSPTVEGVHLRFGKIARGGLRWSDRKEDFRTEILGLVKAQTVKNAVIVPSGAKGGFYVKNLPDGNVPRDLWLQKGIDGYKIFISSLLDLTDNLVKIDGDLCEVSPDGTVCRDEPDSYLVVAADKGTAAFSDIANGLALEYNFWLGDAFASGGSIGYDHKKMGITARGAWESVRSHFRELSVDVDAQDFTVVGIGDMSGDVFGNGMLLSPHIKLVAAFDHRHIFLDPNPDVGKSFVERERLFRLSTSSWDDFDKTIISSGGGVYERTSKSIPVSVEVAHILGISEAVKTLSVNEMIQKILQSPVDLMFNGGIGTYIKSSFESHGDVGDKTNDAVRVDAADINFKIIAEGGNLGITQLGRVEAASKGVLVNNDAIDNSAGVDCSDHEVNIKILLDHMVNAGRLNIEDRKHLLLEMTEEVADLVLQDNVEQNLLLLRERNESLSALPVHRRFMRELEETGELDREIEFLPSDLDLKKRSAADNGLTIPELSVLVAYGKISFVDQLNKVNISSDKWFEKYLISYFPKTLIDKFSLDLYDHPLHNQIINTVIANKVINICGSTAIFRAMEETQASIENITKGFIVAIEVFDIDRLHTVLRSLGFSVSNQVRMEIYTVICRLVDRAARWFIYNGFTELSISDILEFFSTSLKRLLDKLPDLLQGEDSERAQGVIDSLKSSNLPDEMIIRKATIFETYTLLDIVNISLELDKDPLQVAQVYFIIYEKFEIEFLLTLAAQLPRANRWETLARGALRDDVYLAATSITKNILRYNILEVREAVDTWEHKFQQQISRIHSMLNELHQNSDTNMAALAVMLRTLRSVT